MQLVNEVVEVLVPQMNKKTQETMFSSKSDDWYTPEEFYQKLNSEFSFTLDPCASDENFKCKKYYTEEDEGLSKSWAGETVFMNPPYSKVKDWIKKAFNERRKATVVCLIPSRTDTRYFHDYCSYAKEIRFIKGRLKFGDSKNAAPFPSMVVIFDGIGQFPVMKLMERK